MSGISLESIVKGEEIRAAKTAATCGLFENESLLDEDYELRGRREALFHKGEQLANKMQSLRNIVQNPISRKQKMDQFKLGFQQLQAEQRDWFDRVERLVEDYYKS